MRERRRTVAGGAHGDLRKLARLEGGGRRIRQSIRSHVGQRGVNWPIVGCRPSAGLTLSRGAENLTGAVTQRRRLAILVLPAGRVTRG